LLFLFSFLGLDGFNSVTWCQHCGYWDALFKSAGIKFTQ